MIHLFAGQRARRKQRRVKKLLRNLESQPSSLRYMVAVRAASGLRDPGALEPLVQALRRPESHVKEWAAQALGELGDVRAIDPLVAALADAGDPDRPEPMAVRTAAAAALEKLGELAFGELGEIADPSQGLQHLAASGDARLLTPLLRALHQPGDARVRADAAAALGRLGDVRAVQALLAAARDDSWEVRVRACQALGALGTDEAVELLMSEAAAGSPEAVSGLARLGGVRGTDAVIALLDHGEGWRSGEAYLLFRALGEIGGERAFQRLRQEVEGGEPEAIWPLARTADPRVVDVLSRRLGDHDAAAITDSDAIGVANAADALAKLGDPRAVEPLIEVLEDVRNAPVTAEDFYPAEGRRERMLLRVIRALGELGDPRAIPGVQRLATHQPREIEEEARWALRKLESRLRD